jgi:hypothetical protein
VHSTGYTKAGLADSGIKKLLKSTAVKVQLLAPPLSLLFALTGMLYSCSCWPGIQDVMDIISEYHIKMYFH